ncbi:hypothetical protein Tco_0953391 [Tanacetum coccineum]|uniref:Uncharacterized protein n=1 Tax=Tanacetum coccineum TaxID=301880 RepID=A0ABQ5DZQ9_9ASTR
MEDEEVPLVDGVLEGALGALGDEVWVMEFLCHLGLNWKRNFREEGHKESQKHTKPSTEWKRKSQIEAKVVSDGVSNWTSRGVFGEKSIEDEEVSLVDGVLEGALGALGDEIGSLGDGVFVSSWVKSTNNCFGRMMLIFGLLETLEMEALVEAINV